MNIFYLSSNPAEAASMHADGHLNKMIMESAQMLSTTIRLIHGTKQTVNVRTKSGKLRARDLHILPCDELVKTTGLSILASSQVMRETHVNHPCNVWVRECNDNFYWLSRLIDGLLLEWRISGKHMKNHKSYQSVVYALSKYTMANKLPSSQGGHTLPALAMPIQFKIQPAFNGRARAVAAYQDYYKAKLTEWLNTPGKERYAQYNNREVPEFLEEIY